MPWLFLAPSLAGVAVFLVVPFLDVIRRSFWDALGLEFRGLDNYKAVWNNEAFRLASVNTLKFLAVCIPLLMAVSFGLALLLTAGFRWAKTEKRGGLGRIIRTTMVLPMAIPAACMVLIWKILLCPDGVLNHILTTMTGEMWSVDWAFSGYAFPVLVLTYLWKHAGYDMILWLAGLEGISEELYEAAKIDGAGGWACLRYITIPQLTGTFGLVGILSLVNSFRVYREAYLLAGTYPDASIYLIPHLFAHWFFNLDVQKMTAAAVMLTLAFLTAAAPLWIMGRKKK